MTYAKPEDQQHVINAEFDSLAEQLRVTVDLRRIGSRCHPLIDAVHVAFGQHRPLTLSPDSIWLVIAQGFGHHVAENAKALRHRLVRHQGRCELIVKSDDLTLTSFEQAIASFSSQIQQATNPVLHETLICDFSTTSPAIRTASEVALMDSFSSYFTYSMMCVCGIPKITIEGTLDDWQRIGARVKVLATYGLEWWVSRLRPILDQFILAADGHPTREFWKAIYKPVQAYGDKVATGWVTDLFPYLGDAPGRRRNHVFEHERQGWVLPIEKGVETEEDLFFNPGSNKGVRRRGFPSGLSMLGSVVFKDESCTDVDLVAGFLAVQQNPLDLALSPLIGWCVAEPPPKKPMRVWCPKRSGALINSSTASQLVRFSSTPRRVQREIRCEKSHHPPQRHRGAEKDKKSRGLSAKHRGSSHCSNWFKPAAVRVICRLPGFATILAAINDKARHHSWQNPICLESRARVCGGMASS